MRDDTTFASDDKGMGIGQAARKVGEGLGELGRALTDRRNDVVEPIAEFVHQQPLTALGIAFGIGYVLGGGLFTKTTGRLLGLSWKLGGMALARSMLANMQGPGEPGA